jgi:aldose 1-epimerase
MDVFNLRAGNLVVEIRPRLGGAVTRFDAGSFPIFRETPAAPGTVSDSACFPLIPFSNRIRSGAFGIGGIAYQIPVDRRDPRFTNHGHTRHLPWNVVGSSSTELALRFVQGEPNASWPFPFVAEQEFRLEPDRLRMRVRFRNTHTGAAPGGIGLHPYFTRLPDTALGFVAKCVWETDELDIPLRSAAPAGRFDFAKPKALGRLINHAYGGWNQAAEIIHPNRFRIGISCRGAFDHLILFTPADRDFFGFEPVSHRPDALNPLADPEDEGMAMLAPGEILEGSVDINLAGE